MRSFSPGESGLVSIDKCKVTKVVELFSADAFSSYDFAVLRLARTALESPALLMSISHDYI